MYYRITGYYPQKNVSFIADSNGKFEKLWQFSAYLKSMGCDIIAVSRIENMIDENTPQIEYNDKQFCIRTCAMGTSTFSTLKTGGTVYRSLKVGSIEYIPDKDDTL